MDILTRVFFMRGAVLGCRDLRGEEWKIIWETGGQENKTRYGVRYTGNLSYKWNKLTNPITL